MIPDNTVTSSLDFLGRMPIPLRLAFKSGLDKTVVAHQVKSGVALNCMSMTGGEWFEPFARVVAPAHPATLPSMLVVTCSSDILNSKNQSYYQGPALFQPSDFHSVYQKAGIPDPAGIFHPFSVIPFVFLVDKTKLGNRPVPQCWEDLLDPIYHNDITFGGSRSSDSGTYTEFNRFLLLSLYRAFGPNGVIAFAHNVRHLLHHVEISRLMGSKNQQAPAIAILPWMQAELCPRRQQCQIIWPQDGAYTMPIAFMLKPEKRERLQPIIDYLTSEQLGNLLMHNCYPPTLLQHTCAIPTEARFQWLGWEYVRSHNLIQQSELASTLFFNAWLQQQEKKQCS
jgi:ABC-type Fe3+ transport system substrate-binding protein